MASGISAFAPNFQFDNLQTYSIFVAFLFFISCIWTRYSPGLRNVPGPFVASFSNLWKIYRVLKKDMAWQNIEVHEKYGPLVRIGPNHVSASHPEALKTIYNFTNIFPKVRSKCLASHISSPEHSGGIPHLLFIDHR